MGCLIPILFQDEAKKSFGVALLVLPIVVNCSTNSALDDIRVRLRDAQLSAKFLDRRLLLGFSLDAVAEPVLYKGTRQPLGKAFCLDIRFPRDDTACKVRSPQ